MRRILRASAALQVKIGATVFAQSQTFGATKYLLRQSQNQLLVKQIGQINDRLLHRHNLYITVATNVIVDFDFLYLVELSQLQNQTKINPLRPYKFFQATITCLEQGQINTSPEQNHLPVTFEEDFNPEVTASGQFPVGKPGNIIDLERQPIFGDFGKLDL